VTTSANYGLSGWVDLRLAGLLVTGGVIGSRIGLYLVPLLERRFVVAGRLFGGFILLLAIYVGWRALT